MIRIDNPEKNDSNIDIDTITLKIDPKTYFGHSKQNNVKLSDVSIKVIDYIHHHETEKH